MDEEVCRLLGEVEAGNLEALALLRDRFEELGAPIDVPAWEAALVLLQKAPAVLPISGDIGAIMQCMTDNLRLRCNQAGMRLLLHCYALCHAQHGQRPSVSQVQPLLTFYRECFAHHRGGLLYDLFEVTDLSDAYLLSSMEEAQQMGDFAGVGLAEVLLRMTPGDRYQLA